MLHLLFSLSYAQPTASFPAGNFLRGSGRTPDDSPRHEVFLSAFSIDVYEVRISDFEQFVQKAWSDNQYWSEDGQKWRKNNPQGSGSKNRRAGRNTDHPVVAVTWFEAEAYCRWKGGNLPTEAQWERAACSNKEQRFPWGESEDIEAVWYSGGKYGHLQSVLTKPVHQSPPNQRTPEGLLHTVGNVWEWTQDWYHRNSYSQQHSSDPKGPTQGSWKTLRGGSFMNLPSYCSCTHREPATPDRVAFTIGFRCAYSQ